MKNKPKEKKVNTTWRVGIYLIKHAKSRICDMKTCTGSNNVGQRIKDLRERHGWSIETKSKINKDGVKEFYYTNIKVGTYPEKYI